MHTWVVVVVYLNFASFPLASSKDLLGLRFVLLSRGNNDHNLTDDSDLHQ